MTQTRVIIEYSKKVKKLTHFEKFTAPLLEHNSSCDQKSTKICFLLPTLLPLNLSTWYTNFITGRPTRENNVLLEGMYIFSRALKSVRKRIWESPSSRMQKFRSKSFSDLSASAFKAVILIQVCVFKVQKRTMKK